MVVLSWSISPSQELELNHMINLFRLCLGISLKIVVSFVPHLSTFNRSIVIDFDSMF